MTHVGAPTTRGSYSNAARIVEGVLRSLRIDPRAGVQALLPTALTAIAFGLLFSQPIYLLVRDWWTLPEAGHGLLLAPVAIWLAWKSGVRPGASPNIVLGVVFLMLAVVLRYASGLAAELFTMRLSLLLGLAGLTIYHFGFRQLLRWWLPFTLGLFAIPLPELITQALALPLQFKASQMGAAMLEMRNVPVRLTGNIILIPGNELFVTEACSGLRSLTALLSLAVLLGGLMLQKPFTRVLLVALAVPIAVMINGVRVFLTGFLVYYVDPKLGQGFMHLTEGWLLFLVSLTCIGAVTFICTLAERRFTRGEVANA